VFVTNVLRDSKLNIVFLSATLGRDSSLYSIFNFSLYFTRVCPLSILVFVKPNSAKVRVYVY